MLKWTIGAVTVTRILELEGYVEVDEMFAGATAADVRAIPWLLPHFADAEGRFKGSLHTLVVETPHRRIVVDTCVGNDRKRQLEIVSNLKTDFIDQMRAAGYDPNTIDTVLCTHLHYDHVGWNTMLVDGIWRPTFPNARYLFAKAEFEYWRENEEGPTDRIVFDDSVRPVFEAGLVDLIEPPLRICDEVTLVPTPGHSPGHVSVAIESQGARGLITGDFIHHPCQCARPDWSSLFDYDMALTRKTREKMLAEMADTPTLMIGTHFPSPTAGHVVTDGAAYRFKV